MKTAWWIVLLLAAVGINKTTAQYVTIPDSNFVSWLQSNGFSGCMVGDQLDTTCQQVLNAQNITCGPGIANLDGIQYFDSLVSLNCAYNLLTALPQLPDGLSYLDCKNNQLASLPSLPSGLNYLFCSDNQLTQLPTLPGFLNYLDCANNLLTTLPPLPASLEGLDCANNLLTELPPLPVQLGTLIVSDNTGLTCLPPFYIFFGPTPFDFNISNTVIVCLPNYIEHPSYSFYSPIDTMPVCEIVNPNNCEIGWSTFGKTFLDINGDCQQSTEPNLSGIKVILYQDGTAVQQVYTNSFGQHSFNLALDTYTMQIDTANLPFTVSCPANNVHLSYLTASNPLDSTAHFALQCKPGFDLGVIAVVESSG
ncbi:MAG TPA: hypothetical protein VEY71_11060, partial [Chitinophagales bacterium]|nr:hypothetical protein [Chitinophagales bacterium]